MGIRKIFENNSDLVSFGGAKVDNVIQHIFFGIDANKACTHCELTFGDTDFSKQKRDAQSYRHEFIANRPFMFFMEQETSGVLFLFGKVTDPNVVC